MTFYTRRQLLVLMILLTAAGLGLAVGHWRRANPEIVDALEQLDRAPAPPPRVSAPRFGARSRPATVSSAEPEPRRSRRGGAPRDAPPARVEAEPATPVPPVDDVSHATAW